jgi:hypothetical protein|tara:strand:+ start:124 stop:282 length:159 start_codon:yes stop_codon:yes gene_type:complete
MNERYIVKCALRITEKLQKSSYYTHNGEFPPAIKLEIKRMKKLCKKDIKNAR